MYWAHRLNFQPTASYFLRALNWLCLRLSHTWPKSAEDYTAHFFDGTHLGSVPTWLGYRPRSLSTYLVLSVQISSNPCLPDKCLDDEYKY